jgi:hypothetical protein
LQKVEVLPKEEEIKEIIKIQQKDSKTIKSRLN